MAQEHKCTALKWTLASVLPVTISDQQKHTTIGGQRWAYSNMEYAKVNKDIDWASRRMYYHSSVQLHVTCPIAIETWMVNGQLAFKQKCLRKKGDCRRIWCRKQQDEDEMLRHQHRLSSIRTLLWWSRGLIAASDWRNVIIAEGKQLSEVILKDSSQGWYTVPWGTQNKMHQSRIWLPAENLLDLLG